MKLTFQILAALLALSMTAQVTALGLGKLEYDSALNEVFEARIPLLSPTVDELSTLRVSLADEAAFRRAGIDYAPPLRDLRFELVEPQVGEEYILVTSSQPIREPFLNFLVELSWASGRIYREYTVLLDPPVYAERRQSAAPATPLADSERQPATATESPRRPGRADSRAPLSGTGEYGPVQSGETLWSIANDMRPAGVTPQQMMLALLRANPEAFIGNNINALRRGAVLQRPSADQVNRVTAQQAVAEVNNQHDLWEQARQTAAATPGQRGERAAPDAPAETGADAAPAPASDAAADESRLQLLAAAEGGAESPATGAGDSPTQMAEQLAIVNEQLESMRQENAELEDRLAENEALIEDLKRLIALKDDELASLQDRSIEEAAVAAEPATGSGGPDGHTVLYPNGDPAQFIRTESIPEGVAPAPAASAEPELSHEVVYPGDTAPDDAAIAEPPAVAEAPPTEATPTPQATPDAAPDATSDAGLMTTLTGLLGTARNFVMTNITMVGAALLAVIALLAAMMIARRRRDTAAADAQAEADLPAEFPDLVAADRDGAAAPAAAAGAAGTLEPFPAQAEESTGGAAEDDAGIFMLPEGEESQGTAHDEEGADPLAEVNVLMAYEHFDQAEAFVRNALKSDPDNIEYHAKLLEVFYAANDKRKYEAAASDLRDLTGARGEHWAMAVAMWQEMSPNRPLFESGEAGDEADDDATVGGGGGIVDITGDTAGGDTAATGAGIDFDLTDSTGGGAQTDSGDDGEMLDLTAAGDEAGEDDGMLDLTAAGNVAEDDNSLDFTATAGSTAAYEATRTGSQADAPQADDGLDFSLGGADSADLLDVTSGKGDIDSDESLLDVTASGAGGSTDDDDYGLDFTLDSDTDEKAADSDSGTTPQEDAEATVSGVVAAGDDSASLAGSTAGGQSPADDSTSGVSDSLDMEIDSYDDSDDLQEIGAELDRLEMTLGTLSRQESTHSGLTDTSDALDGIDSALEDFNPEEDSDKPSVSVAGQDVDDDFALSLDTDAGEDARKDAGENDQSSLSVDLDDDLQIGSGTDDDTALDFEFETEDATDNATGDDELDDDLTALSRELDGNTGDIEDEAAEIDSSAALDFDFDLDEPEPAGASKTDDGGATDDAAASLEDNLSDDDLSLDTLKMNAADNDDDSNEHGFDLDFDLDGDDDPLKGLDMDSTVELPRQYASDSGLSLTDDDGGGDDDTMFVARGGDGDEQSLEDELTTKLDLAKAYVELGDSDSARSILEEVMHDGSENQKRQAGDLLQQL